MGSGESSEGTGGGVERPRLLSFVRPEQVPDRVGDWEVGVGWCQSASPITLGTGVWVLGEARAGPRSEAGTGIGARFPRRGAGWVVFVWFLRGDRTFETVSVGSCSLFGLLIDGAGVWFWVLGGVLGDLPRVGGGGGGFGLGCLGGGGGDD